MDEKERRQVFDNYMWKNSQLSAELHIVGTFIYNSLKILDEMKNLKNEYDCFEFLYNCAVGIERLEKIVIILLYPNNNYSQKELEKSFKIHNHIELLNKIKSFDVKLSLGEPHIRFLELLRVFYKRVRYDRFQRDSVNSFSKEIQILFHYLSKERNLTISKEIIGRKSIDGTIKNYLGKVILTITRKLYKIIEKRSRELNMFTYKIEYGSKAEMIFLNKEYSFERERLIKKEILIFLLKSVNKEELFQPFNSIEPLDLDNINPHYLISAILNSRTEISMIERIEYLYKENKLGKERLELLKEIGEIDPSVISYLLSLIDMINDN